MRYMYHGTRNGFTKHAGQCFTSSLSSALAYAQGGFVAVVQVTRDGLTVERVESYNPSTDTAPGDDGVASTDILEHDDSDPSNGSHDTVRAMSAAAIAAVAVVAVVPADWAVALEDVEEREWSALVEAWSAAGAEADDYDVYDGDLALWREEN